LPYAGENLGERHLGFSLTGKFGELRTEKVGGKIGNFVGGQGE